MSEDQIRQTLQDKGCLYTPDQGYHFVGVSGKHLSGYCNIDPALPDVKFVAALTSQLVKPFSALGVQTVLAPAIGAIPLAQWGPHFLMEMTGKPVLGIWADKIKPRGFVIERTGFAEAIIGKKVLILEDMINQMFSVGELVRIVRELGGEVVGVGALVANSGASADKIGVDNLVRLLEFSYDAWEPEACELCKQEVPIVIDSALGHGDEYQALNPEYAGGYVSLEQGKA